MAQQYLGQAADPEDQVAEDHVPNVEEESTISQSDAATGGSEETTQEQAGKEPTRAERIMALLKAQEESQPEPAPAETPPEVEAPQEGVPEGTDSTQEEPAEETESEEEEVEPAAEQEK